MKILKIILFFICLQINSKKHRQRKLDMKRKISDGLNKAGEYVGKYYNFAKKKVTNGIETVIGIAKESETKMLKRIDIINNKINEEIDLKYYYKHRIEVNENNVHQRILQIKLTMHNMDEEYNQKIDSLNNLMKGEEAELEIEDRELNEKIKKRREETLEIEKELKDDLELKDKVEEQEILDHEKLENNEIIVTPENVNEVDTNKEKNLL